MKTSTSDASATQRSLDLKPHQKEMLQETVGFMPEPRRALLCLPSGMTDQLGGKLFEQILPGILTLPLQIVVLGKGSTAYGKLLSTYANAEPHRVAILKHTADASKLLLAGADMALFCAPEEEPEFHRALSLGAVPIAPVCPLLEDYNPNQERGNAFLYEECTPWHCFAAIVRALETYRFPFDWKTIQRHGLESDIGTRT
jgi:glycogen synthase